MKGSTRARTKIDAGRLSAIVGRPGIDPRAWIRFGVITDIAFDPQFGEFADVTLQPDGQQITAMVGIAYAGNGFGLWAPLHIEDIVLVAIADGDMAQGCVIISRFHRESDKPPADFRSSSNAEDPTDDVVLRVESGKKLTIRTAGDAGNISIKAESNGSITIDAAGSSDVTVKNSGTGNVYVTVSDPVSKVFLGASSGTQPLTLGQTIQSYLNAQQTWASLHVHPETGVNTGPPTVPPPTVPTVTATKVNGV